MDACMAGINQPQVTEAPVLKLLQTSLVYTAASREATSYLATLLYLLRVPS